MFHTVFVVIVGVLFWLLNSITFRLVSAVAVKCLEWFSCIFCLLHTVVLRKDKRANIYCCALYLLFRFEDVFAQLTRHSVASLASVFKKSLSLSLFISGKLLWWKQQYFISDPSGLLEVQIVIFLWFWDVMLCSPKYFQCSSKLTSWPNFYFFSLVVSPFLCCL